MPAPVRPDLSQWNDRELAALWIGHSTVLLRIGGLNLLTDPVFSDRIGLGFGLFTGGPMRLFAPALAIAQLPPIDLVLISHAHLDHLDRPSLMRLPKTIPVITARHTAELVRDLGFRHVQEMQWGQSARFKGLDISAQEVVHWGARSFIDAHRGYNAYLLGSPSGRVFFGGDSAYCDLFKPLAPVDLAILGIGGYEPHLRAHATPEQALEMADHLGAELLFPMHHSTFRLSLEPVGQPMQRLLEAARGRESRIVIRRIGECWYR